MSNPTEMVVDAFAGAIAGQVQASLVDGEGNPAYVDVPLDSDASAQLGYNLIQQAWVVVVTKSIRHLSHEARESLMEQLVAITNIARYGSAQICGLTDDGRISVANVMKGTPDRSALSNVIESGLGLLSLGDQVTGAGPVAADVLAAQGWIRI
jgi:hypothetical protein